jgi:phage terminase large subunit-like protein
MAEAYHYDATAADKAVAFFEQHLRFTEGEWAGRPFRLEAWQADDIIRPLFGWKRADGTRRYRRCFVWVPRKNGKTELAAGVAMLALLGDAEPGGQVYSIAKDKDQARLVFTKATSMVQRSPTLSPLLECLKPSIYCPSLNAAFKPLSGNPEGKHGLSMSGLIGDEIHEWPSGELYTFVHQSSVARRQALEFLISTAGKQGGYGAQVWEECMRVREDPTIDPETLVIIYAADPDDDWAAPATWAKANPNLGVSVKREYLEAECRRAQESPRLENDFRRYHLNQWTAQDVRWISLDRWDRCAGAVAWADLPEHLKGREAWGGLDIASTMDLTSLKWVFPPQDEGEPWHVVSRFFCPAETIEARTRRDRVAYERWVREGALKATPGNVLDYSFVRQQIYEDAERFRVMGLAIDRWNATQLAVELGEEGLPVVMFGQGFASMSAPAKELERLVLSGDLAHGGHPVLRWCVGNVAVETDAAGNIKPSKAKSAEKIDGVISTVMGLGITTKREAVATNPWEDETFSMGVG